MSESGGGAIHYWSSRPLWPADARTHLKLENVSFQRNVAGGDQGAGAVLVYGIATAWANATFERNQALGGWGGAARLAEVVGSRSAALRLLLHQPRLSAADAERVGLADAVATMQPPTDHASRDQRRLHLRPKPLLLFCRQAEL